MKVLGRKLRDMRYNQMDLKIMSFNLNENEREMVSTAAFGVCAMRRILRYIRAHFLRWCSVPPQHIFPPVPESAYEG